VARPRKQIVDYFPHDTDASGGKVETVLQNKYGNDGYAFWFRVKELLGRSPGHFYNFKVPDDWEFLLAKTHIPDTETAKGILETLAILGAIDPKLYRAGIIWSQDFVDSVEIVYKKRMEKKPERPNSVGKTPISETVTLVSVSDNSPSSPHTPLLSSKHSKVKDSIVLTPKGGQHKAVLIQKNAIVTEIFTEMRTYLGFPDKTDKDPIPSYGKEGQAIKRMLARGFTREAIVECWKGKVSQRGGEFVSMTWVNEDIGKPEKQKRRPKELSTEEEIAASIKEVEL
jgi:hypothetical protein